jgi:PhnB protein
MVQAIPEGYRTLTPYLCVKGAAQALDFYRNVFGANVLMRMDGPGGMVGHAEIEIGDSRLMLADEFPCPGARAPSSLGGSAVTLHLYVQDVDAVVRKAVEAGAKPVGEIEDRFWGDRSGTVEDPFGHLWHIATHVEDVPPDEIARRAAECMGQAEK